ncbi:MAG: hypothetical protein AABW50_03060 [Nanoarchaeota archaeon]
MDKKIILYGIVIVSVLLLTLISSGVIKINLDKEINSNSVSSGNYDDIPEKCRPTAGYTVELWKEHLGHHADTKDCLEYFN